MDVAAPSLVRSIRKYLNILRISLVERLHYRADFFIATLFRFLPLVTSFLLWNAVYDSLEQPDVSQPTELNGFTRNDVMAYLLLVQISRMFSSMPGLAGGIARDIRDGNLKKYLLQPVDMVAYLLSYRGAHKIAYIATSALPYGLLFWLYWDVFPPLPDWGTLAAYGLSLILGFLLGFFFEVCIGCIGFWLLEVTSFLYIVNTVNFFVSGHMFPLDMLKGTVSGQWLLTGIRLTPFPYLAYYPAMIFLGKETGESLLRGLLIETAWVVGLMVLSRILYNRGLRHYSAYGG